MTEHRYTNTLNFRRFLLLAALIAVLGFVVSEGGVGRSQTGFDLHVSPSADRSGGVSLEGQAISGDVAIFVSPDAGISRVQFLFDGVLVKTENNAPWDFAGTASNGTAQLYDSADDTDGEHVITAQIDLSGGGTVSVDGTFMIANSAPALAFNPGSLQFSKQETDPDPTEQGAQLTATDGSSVAFSLTENASWLTASASSGTTPQTINFSVDSSALSTGSHSTTVTAAAAGYPSANLTVTFTITGAGGSAHQLLVSESANRSGPRPLDGTTVSGDIFVFVTSTESISRVAFALDGVHHQNENSAPWDFSGGSASTANPFATTDLPDGVHTITATIESNVGTEIVSGAFTISNDGPALMFNPGALVFSGSQANNPPSQDSTVATTNGSFADFTLTDNANWVSLNPTTGSTPDNVTISVNTSGLQGGLHTATVTASAPGFADGILTVTLNMSAPRDPDQVHLAWVGEPSTTLTVVWRTLEMTSPSTVEYRRAGTSTWQTANGSIRPSGTDGALHEVTLSPLTPSTTYEYRVPGDGGTISDIFTARTAPAPGPADFDAIYFADTGLTGRTDGLATGTEQAVDEIANLNPLLTLPGGDYAYSDSDLRFASLDDAIDAWFNQVQPFAAESVMMPTYGNHEVLLESGFDEWAARFPTPNGFDQRRYYSFDIGDVHFVSILAVRNFDPIPSAAVQWIEQDISAAVAAGKRWVIPYMHVAAFADGRNHPSNTALRDQLGPVFEQFGVKVVLTSHDQAYERTYPLVDIGGSDTPTSSSLGCYTMNDGMTWVKSSPAGKLSNINGTFSDFRTDPAPYWTAFRDNTMHHFTRLVFSADGSLRVDTYGVVGDGTPPTIIDSFEYSDSCPDEDPELRFNPTAVSFAATEGSPVADQTTTLSTSDGSTAAFTITDNASWLTASPGSGSTSDTITLAADTSGLAAGTHSATVGATAGGYGAAQLNVTLTISPQGGGSGRELHASNSPDRSGSLPLNGATISGDVAIFTTMDSGVQAVRFYLGTSLQKTENNPPFDYNGTAGDGTAVLYDSTELTDGVYTITAEVDLSGGGTEIIAATFTVANDAPALAFSPGSLLFSADEGETVADKTVDVLVTDGSSVAFNLADDADWLSVNPTTGTTTDTVTVSVNSASLALGTHTGTITATAPGFLSASLTVTISISGAGASPHQLLVSTSPDRSNPVSLDGQTLSGDVYIFVTSPVGVRRVSFALDGSHHQNENKPPWDFNGGSVSSANALDTTTLPDGVHMIAASVQLLSGGTDVLVGTFTIDNLP